MANMTTHETEGDRHGAAVKGMAYVRPGWTGRPAHYSDGQIDPDFSECPSCLSHHAASYIGCNGKREPCDRQCEAVLGEIRCHRPANHLGEHEADSALLRVEWEVK